MARAAELVGDAVRAKAYYSQLLTLGQTGDSERPELAQAQAFLAKK